MKITLITLVVFSLLITVYFFILGLNSQSMHPPGLINGRLASCPNIPNCACSEDNTHPNHYISPISISGNSHLTPEKLKELIQNMGGSIQTETEHYIGATFTSTFFKFVDDFEIRIDKDNNLLQLRSSSRVGHSDLGTNKKRIELFKHVYETVLLK